MPVSLNAITLCNFKSIRGQVTIAPFSQFTAIIGPNGSGKSNIMDGIRFVLGEKPNALRVNYLSELVHGTVVGRPRMEGTYVKIVFMGDDNEEKSFTRSIYNKDCQYSINDKIVTHSFYMVKLKEFGLDINLSNFLMSQGNTECFATKLPKELTITFEMISGSDRYKQVYMRLMKKSQGLKEKIHYMYQMKKQLLRQKAYVIAEINEAKKYLELQEQYIEVKTKFQLVQLFLIKEVVKVLQNEKREKKSQMEQCLRKKKDVRLSLKQHELQFISLSNFLEAVEKNIQELENIIHDDKAQHVVLMETISCWQEKRACAHVHLDNANKARHANIKIIQELKNELEQINNKLEEMRVASQDSMELTNSQIKRYWDLKNKVEYQVKDFIKQITKLMCDQESDRNKLENENRIKQELEDKIKRTTLMKDDLEKLLQKLEDSNVKFKVILVEKMRNKQKLINEITEMKNTSSKLENDITKISEKLGQADTTLQQIKKTEIIEKLKQFYHGVYGRLSQLCNPIHLRYYVPTIKVFGKNMDAIVVDTANTAIQCIEYLKQQKLNIETFLPLDSIKPVCLREKLRDIKEPKNVKLLFDVLNITSAQIGKAVLFVTKNTLVCETAEDARRMAYEIDKYSTYDCVSLDGCFYRRNGLISGGQSDLVSKAKQWQAQRKCDWAWDISVLERQKEELMKELNKLPNILRMQSDLDILEKEIEGFLLRVKYIQQDIKDSKSKIEEMYEILQKLTQELSLSNSIISEIQHNMQEANKNIKNIQKHIDTIGNEIFANFCEDINIPDISYYEKNNLRIYKEEEQKRMDLEKQYDCIKNQLYFENECDIEGQILKWKRALEQADAKLNKVHQQETIINKKIEQEEIKLSELKVVQADKQNDLNDITKKQEEYKLEIRDMAKLYLENQTAHIVIQKQIDQKEAECNAILKECKLEGITVPIAEIPHVYGLGDFPSTSTSSISNAESSYEWDISTKIDFSQFPENILNSAKENLQNIVVELHETLADIKNQIEAIVNPNLKVHEKIDSIVKDISNLNKKLKSLRKDANQIEKKLNEVREKRCNLFRNCLESVTAVIDPIYKNLVKETSAQALLVSDNIEELFAGGLHYSCIPPFKSFQPISSLSGGEKSLASLALQFAIQRCKPAPFFIMDEGDAALDETNIENFACFIRSHLKPDDMKVIMITLQKSLMSHSDVLIGVTTEPDAKCTESKIFSISLDKYVSRRSK